MPIPVIIATGHTADTSLLDEIVRYAAKTPSDAAHLIID
jgi:exonuclease VII large subunit